MWAMSMAMGAGTGGGGGGAGDVSLVLLFADDGVCDGDVYVH